MKIRLFPRLPWDRSGAGARWSSPAASTPRRFPTADWGLLAKVGVAVILSSSCYGLLMGDHGWLRLRDLKKRDAALTAKLSSLQTRIDDLERRLAEPRPQRQERSVRERYRQARSDEILYVIDRSNRATAKSDSVGDPIE